MERSAELKQSCIGYQGNLAMRYKELERLLVSPENLSLVRTKTYQLQGVFLLYEAKFKEYIASLGGRPAEYIEDAEEQFAAHKRNKEEFDERVLSWSAAMKPAVGDDRHSLVSKKSSRSTLSSASSSTSMRAKEARARQKLAEQRLKQLAEKRALEEQRRKLTDRLAELDIENERDNAEVEADFWTQEAEEEVKEEEGLSGKVHVDLGSKQLLPIDEKPPSVQVAQEKRADEFVGPSDIPIGLGVSNNRSQGDHISVDSSQSSAQQLCDAMMLAMNMPKPELVGFDGEPTKYWSFIHTFDVNIACKINDERTKLMYLTQFCVGKAKEAIECCCLMNPVDGYKSARAILKQQFGQSHIIKHSLIEKVISRPQVKPGDGYGLSELAREMRRCLVTLEQMGHTADLNASDTLLKIQLILPAYLQSRWAERAHCLLQGGEEPGFAHMTDLVEKAAQIANNMYGKNIGKPNTDLVKSSSQKGHYKASGHRVTTLATEVQDDKREWKPTCPLCEEEHYLSVCPQFKEKTQRERVRIARQKRLCDNCLKPRHIAKDCRGKPACEMSGCTGKHHSLLHATHEENRSETSVTGAGDDKVLMTESSSGTNLSMVGSKKVCLRVVPVKVRANGKEIVTWAILDDGSDVSLCDRTLAKELGLRGEERRFMITTISQDNCSMKGSEVSFAVTGVGESETINLDAVWTVDKLPISKESIPKQDDIAKWPHLQGIMLPQIEEGQVKLLIGGDVPEAFWVVDERRGRRKEPYAIRSLLGWTIMGPTSNSSNGRRMSSFRTTLASEDDILHKQVERFWQMDSAGTILGTDVGESVDDKKARAKMEKSMKKIDGHYQLDLPWKDARPCLPNNRPLAEARLRYLKKKLEKDESLLQMYKDTVQSYLEKGYARQLPSEAKKTNKVWYLPHHPVVHPHKPNKVRVVFDCAAKYRGISLNSQLLQGPDFTNSLVGVLTRFRQGKIALVADIEGMFHQVRVTPEDCDALRFLWWPDGDLQSEPKEYQMLVHLFGATSSPSCAGYALRKTAEDSLLDSNNEAVRTVIENFYVDDCLKSVETQEEAVALAEQLRKLLQGGGFRLTKWISNNPEVLKTIPESERAASVLDLGLDDLPTERTLGILWNVKTDQFGFKVAIKEKPATRRGILSVTSSLYDPLGFVSPFVLTAKFLLQDTCAQGLGWDEPVGETEDSRWREWLEELPQLSDISIDRCLKPSSDKDIKTYELHVFCDASQRGYAAVVYLRTIDTGGNIHCSFVIGKTRLCPQKAMTIPRLELSAAVLACTLSETARRDLQLPISTTTYWTDSTSVLQYLRNESRRFHTFVANRIAKIHDVSDPSQWRHVDTKSNPADDGSRGLHAIEMTKDCRWITGPKYLWESETHWPLMPSVLEGDHIDSQTNLEGDPEAKKCHVNITKSTDVNTTDSIKKLMERHSTWNRLKRGVGWILRYKQYLRSKKSQKFSSDDGKSDLTAHELNAAETAIIQYAQYQAFPDQFMLRAEGKSTRTNKRLGKLNPTIKDGLLRVGGRLGKAPIGEDEKHPLILPYDHHITALLIVHHHTKVGHSGAGLTWTSLREKYWVIRGGATVRRVIGKCFECKRRNAPRGEQFMADLPLSRVTPDKPAFTNTGIDFFGPFTVKQGRTTRKRYGCIFTCLASRAVHLEVASSLDTDSFLNALRRFMNRRGQPEKILSDNGTNFKGGERELRESLSSLNSSKIGRILGQKGIHWEFNPPGASHMGGAWERIIRSVRKILRSLLGQQLLSDEALTTYMTEVEAILNSRPLTQLSMDPRDEEPLTPNHLLLLRKTSPLPPGIFSKEDSYSRRRWRQVQYLADQFWKRWVREYLPILQERQKWSRPKRNFTVDDLVLIVNDQTPRGQWALGRITQTYPDKRGYVRRVEIKVGAKYFKRPITKLCLLESS